MVAMSANSAPTVLHYFVGDSDESEFAGVVQTLAREGLFTCVLGVAPGFQAQREPALTGGRQRHNPPGGGDLPIGEVLDTAAIAGVGAP